MMAEVSFRKEIESLRLGDGETFYGEGILAVTKALLQSGVAYVGGYQGAPVSHLLDVLVQVGGPARRTRHPSARPAPTRPPPPPCSAPPSTIRCAARSPGSRSSAPTSPPTRSPISPPPACTGGALIIVGEDYGEGASVIQERTHAFALKSSLWLLDPRPELPTHRADGREGLRAVGSLQHAGHPRAAHPRLPRVRQLRRQGQRGRRGSRPSDRLRAGQLQLRAPEPSAGDLPPGGRQDRAAAAGGAASSSSTTSSTSARARPTATSASSCRAACSMC